MSKYVVGILKDREGKTNGFAVVGDDLEIRRYSLTDARRCVKDKFSNVGFCNMAIRKGHMVLAGGSAGYPIYNEAEQKIENRKHLIVIGNYFDKKVCINIDNEIKLFSESELMEMSDSVSNVAVNKKFGFGQRVLKQLGATNNIAYDIRTLASKLSGTYGNERMKVSDGVVELSSWPAIAKRVAGMDKAVAFGGR